MNFTRVLQLLGIVTVAVVGGVAFILLLAPPSDVNLSPFPKIGSGAPGDPSNPSANEAGDPTGVASDPKVAGDGEVDVTSPPKQAAPNSWPTIVEVSIGEPLSFILTDGQRRTVEVTNTNLEFAYEGTTVWATATVQVSGPGLEPERRTIPAAYLQAPTVIHGVRIYVAITKEFNDGRLRDGGGTNKDARLILSDAEYTMTDTSAYQWPFATQLWGEGSRTVYWQGLEGGVDDLFHHGAIDVGMQPNTPVSAWSAGKLTEDDLVGAGREAMIGAAAPDQALPSANSVLHLSTIYSNQVGAMVEAGDAIGLSGEANWWHTHISGGAVWTPLMAEWYTAHASAEARSYIKDWLVAGPFEIETESSRMWLDPLGDERHVEPNVGDQAGGYGNWRLSGIEWKRWDNVVPGVVNVGEAVSPYPFSGWAWNNGNYPDGVAYLATYVYSPDRQSAVLIIGSSDAVEIWLGPQRVFSRASCIGTQSDQDPTFVPDQHQVAVTLESGWNRLLVKTAQFDACPPSWQFSLRIAHESGAPIQGLTVSSTRQPDGQTPLLAPSVEPMNIVASHVEPNSMVTVPAPPAPPATATPSPPGTALPTPNGNGSVTPAPTASPTRPVPTATHTPSPWYPTPTRTPVAPPATATSTRTPLPGTSVVPTATGTATYTPTHVVPTATPTLTATSTAVPTPTPTEAASPTPAPTPVPTATPGPTVTPTPTPGCVIVLGIEFC